MIKYKYMTDEEVQLAEDTYRRLIALRKDENAVNITLSKEEASAILSFTNNCKFKNATLSEQLCIARNKFNLDKVKHRKKAKVYRDKLQYIKDYINKNKKEVMSHFNGKTYEYQYFNLTLDDDEIKDIIDIIDNN